MSVAVETPVRDCATLLAGLVEAPALPLSDIALDSREVTPGTLFLACQGHRMHGLEHAADAVERGAAAVAWEPVDGIEAPALAVPAFAVPELSSHVGTIASRFFGAPSRRLRAVGITGTDGKTSTAHLLAQAWTTLGVPCVYLGTLGYGPLGALDPSPNTTPDAVRLQRVLARAVNDGAGAAALEVSSHALAQNRISATHFSAAVLTNVGRDHLDYHGDLENYAAAKRRLFDRDDTGDVVLNRDDTFGAEWAARLHGSHRIIVYGLGGAAPATPCVVGRDLSLHADGLSLTLSGSFGEATLRSPLLGRFNAYNLLAAAAALVANGVPLTEACAALAGCTTVPGRAEAFRGPDAAPLVVVDYAHTPQALAQILQALRPHAAGRLICVFGCGGDRDAGKRPLMGASAAQFADAVVITDDNPRSESPARIVAEVRAGMPRTAKVDVIHDRAEAIRSAVAMAGAADVVLVAGKGHEEVQQYGREARAFSDRAFVAALVGREHAA